MSDLLRRDRPDVVVEVLDDASALAVANVANAHGYRHYLLTSAGPVATAEVRSYYPRYLNYLLSTRSAAEIGQLTQWES
jgi:hypothetical protein